MHWCCRAVAVAAAVLFLCVSSCHAAYLPQCESGMVSVFNETFSADFQPDPSVFSFTDSFEAAGAGVALAQSVVEVSQQRSDPVHVYGPFSASDISLRLSNLPAHTRMSVHLSLAALGSWDGYQTYPESGSPAQPAGCITALGPPNAVRIGTGCGCCFPDTFELRTQGDPAGIQYSTSFGQQNVFPWSIEDIVNHQTTGAEYPTEPVHSISAVVTGWTPSSALMYPIHVSFPHTATSDSLLFGMSGTESIFDEAMAFEAINICADVQAADPLLSQAEIIAIIVVSSLVSSAGAMLCFQRRREKVRPSGGIVVPAAQERDKAVPSRPGKRASIVLAGEPLASKPVPHLAYREGALGTPLSSPGVSSSPGLKDAPIAGAIVDASPVAGGAAASGAAVGRSGSGGSLRRRRDSSGGSSGSDRKAGASGGGRSGGGSAGRRSGNVRTRSPSRGTGEHVKRGSSAEGAALLGTMNSSGSSKGARHGASRRKGSVNKSPSASPGASSGSGGHRRHSKHSRHSKGRRHSKGSRGRKGSKGSRRRKGSTGGGGGGGGSSAAGAAAVAAAGAAGSGTAGGAGVGSAAGSGPQAGGIAASLTQRVAAQAQLAQVLARDNFVMVAAIDQVTIRLEADALARTLVDVFDSVTSTRGMLEYGIDPLIAWAVQREVDRSQDRKDLLRQLSLSTRIISCRVAVAGYYYLRSVLQPVVALIIKCDKPTEVDPSQVPAGQKIKHNQTNLKDLTSQVLVMICESITELPVPLRNVASTLRERIGKKYSDKLAWQNALANVLFLRFLCPAIVVPHLNRLVDAAPDDLAARRLLLVSKLLQLIAHGDNYTLKEPYMKPMKDFIKSSGGLLRKFLLDVSTPPPPGTVDASMMDRASTKSDHSAANLAHLFAVVNEAVDPIASYVDQHGKTVKGDDAIRSLVNILMSVGAVPKRQERELSRLFPSRQSVRSVEDLIPNIDSMLLQFPPSHPRESLQSGVSTLSLESPDHSFYSFPDHDTLTGRDRP